MPSLREHEKVRVESLRAAKARLDASHVDLMSVLDQQIKLVKTATDAMEREFIEAPGKPAFTEKDARRLKELASAADVAVAARVKLETHIKKIGESMTPGELLEAAVLKIKSLPRTELSAVINSLRLYYDGQNDGRPGRKLVTASDALDGLSLPEPTPEPNE